MSTKGLMAHKKVSEVTLNEAGKAATLTLKEPWRYKGESGPFTLISVDHGHDIVKKARHKDDPQYDGKDWVPARKAGEPGAPKVTRGVATDGHGPSGGCTLLEPSLQPVGGPNRQPGAGIKRMAIYHGLITDPEAGHEVSVWLKYPRPMPDRARIEDALKAAAPMMKGPASSYTERKVTRWTLKDERAAKAAGHAGSPWPREHELGGDAL